MEQGQRIVAVMRHNIRDLSYRLRTAGMCAGGRLHLEESMAGLVLAGIVAFFERFEVDCLDEDERTTVLCSLYVEFLYDIINNFLYLKC